VVEWEGGKGLLWCGTERRAVVSRMIFAVAGEAVVKYSLVRISIKCRMKSGKSVYI
jgi:hypothetical protein